MPQLWNLEEILTITWQHDIENMNNIITIKEIEQ